MGIHELGHGSIALGYPGAAIQQFSQLLHGAVIQLYQFGAHLAQLRQTGVPGGCILAVTKPG